MIRKTLPDSTSGGRNLFYVSYLGSPLSHLVRETIGAPSSRQSRTWKSIA